MNIAENLTAIVGGRGHLQFLTFGWTDYLLFGGLLGISILIGIYFGFFGKKQDNTTEYLLGGKTMTFFPVSMSLIASHISGVSLLGVPSEVYLHGTQYAMCWITSVVSTALVATVYLPVFHKLQLTSTFEYLELRFSRSVRLLASFIYTISLILYIPLVIYVPALAFSQATDISLHMITPVICIVCIFYTTIGGLKAVVWTDTVQLSVTIGSLFAVLILGIISVGGVSEILRLADEGGRLIFLNTDPNPSTRNSIWAMSLGLTTTWIAGLGVSQGSMQRFLAVPTVWEAQKALMLLGAGCIMIKWISVFTGLIMFAKYHGCDPVSAHVVEKNDQILPYYVMDVASDFPGLPGLFLAGLVSAGLSTMSASLNTAAGTIYEDFIQPWVPNKDNEKKEAQAAKIMKVTVIILGVTCVCMIFLVSCLGDIFQVSYSLNGITAGALLGIFSLGLMVPWATVTGALSGGITSMILMTWICTGAQYHMANANLIYKPLPVSTEKCAELGVVVSLVNQTLAAATSSSPMGASTQDEPFVLYTLSFMYYTLVGAATTMIVGTVVSFMFGPADLKDVDRDHFSPFVKRFLPRSDKKYAEVSLHSVPTAPMMINPEKEPLNGR